MFGRKQFLLFFLLIASLTNSQNIPTKSATSRTFSTNSNANILSKKVSKRVKLVNRKQNEFLIDY
jgi:hypothetical protein